MLRGVFYIVRNRLWGVGRLRFHFGLLGVSGVHSRLIGGLLGIVYRLARGLGLDGWLLGDDFIAPLWGGGIIGVISVVRFHRLRCRSFSLRAWLSLLRGLCRGLRSRLRIVCWLRRNIALIRKLGVHICSWLGLISSRCRFFIATLVATCVLGSLCAWLGLFCFLSWSLLGTSVRARLSFRCLFCLRGGSTYAGYSAKRDQRSGTGGNSGANLDHWSLSTMCASFLVLRILRVLRVLRRTPLWRKSCAIPTAIVYYFCLLTSPKVFTCVYFPFTCWDFLLYLPEFPNLIHSNKTGQYPHFGAGVNIPIS